MEAVTRDSGAARLCRSSNPPSGFYSDGKGEGSELSIDIDLRFVLMARPLRIEYPGAIYYVLSRGDRREAIFRTDADRRLFLDLLGQTCRSTGWQIHAYGA